MCAEATVSSGTSEVSFLMYWALLGSCATVSDWPDGDPQRGVLSRRACWQVAMGLMRRSCYRREFVAKPGTARV